MQLVHGGVDHFPRGEFVRLWTRRRQAMHLAARIDDEKHAIQRGLEQIKQERRKWNQGGPWPGKWRRKRRSTL
jgi:hypothetical protein